ncbi:MAG: hypothetical protein MN733_37890 [Nitrososphaera sp.]|nr:hypothetical protein [Nitrososphaera sp.]
MSEDTRIAISIAVTKSFDQGDGTTWQTTVPQEAPLGEINKVVDKVHAAISRQVKWQRVERLGNEIEHAYKQGAQLQYTLASMEVKYKDMSWPKDARSAYDQTKDNIIRQNTLVDSLKRELEALKKELS